MRSFLIFIGIFCPLFIFSQVEDQFTDGNFTLKPNWIGTDTKFEINTSFQLRTKDTIADTAFLSVKNELKDLDEKEWRFWIKQSFSPSANNFTRVYLTATSYDLKSQPDGIFLQFGESGSADAIRLYKSENKVVKELGNGTPGAIATNFIVAVKVVREKDNTWRVYTDYNGGENYGLEINAYDPTPKLGDYFGFFCKYTKTNATKFYFDNVYVGDKTVDKSIPILTTIKPVNPTQIQLEFNESIDTSFVLNTSNYTINSNEIIHAKRDTSNTKNLILTLNEPLINAVLYSVEIKKVQDLSFNLATNLSKSFYYLIAEKPAPGDVIINEIMANPSPPVGLAELEYLEVYNNSNKYFNLENWVLTDGTSKGKIANGWLAPHTYRLLCNTNSLAFMNQALGVTSFPSLNNSGDHIQLLDTSGLLLNEIQYDVTWYHDESKSSGGWSLERINPNHPCSDVNNWKASSHPDGGTPGEQNAVFDTLKNTLPIQVSSVEVVDSITLKVSFNQHVKNSNPIVTFSPELGLDTIMYEFYSCNLSLKNPVKSSKEYTLTLKDIQNCWGDKFTVSSPFAFTETPSSGDLVINEILFNPYTDGSDFVEIKNVSSKWINANSLAFGNLNQGILTSEKVNTSRYIKPGEIVFFATEKESHLSHYPNTKESQFIQTKLPAYNNDSGTVILLINNQIIDKVNYQENWHFSLLNDFDGKSVERISTTVSSQDKTNWQTAAQTHQFATPGDENSHSFHTTENIKEIYLTSSVISPDNDGVDDVLELNFNKEETDLTTSVTIYRPNGEKIREWLKNEFIGKNFKAHWDGQDYKGKLVDTGSYLIVIEVINSKNGNTQTLKIPFGLIQKE